MASGGERELIMVHTSPDGHRYALLALDEGGFAMTRDGVRMEGQEWTAGQLDDAVQAFVAITELAPPAQ